MDVSHSSQTARVLVADDHEMVRDAIRASLQQCIDIVAEVANGLDAVAAASVLRPDLVLMDLSLPGMSGIDATRRITTRLPGVRVLCVSMHSDTVFVTAAFDAGAAGYVLKESPLDELVTAIETVLGGRRYVDPRVAAPNPTGALPKPARGDGPEARLTPREIEVLTLVADGYTNKETALRLGLSPKTVSTHRQSVMDKLGIHHAGGLTRYAIEHGLIELEPESDSPHAEKT